MLCRSCPERLACACAAKRVGESGWRRAWLLAFQLGLSILSSSCNNWTPTCYSKTRSFYLNSLLIYLYSLQFMWIIPTGLKRLVIKASFRSASTAKISNKLILFRSQHLQCLDSHHKTETKGAESLRWICAKHIRLYLSEVRVILGWPRRGNQTSQHSQWWQKQIQISSPWRCWSNPRSAPAPTTRRASKNSLPPLRISQRGRETWKWSGGTQNQLSEDRCHTESGTHCGLMGTVLHGNTRVMKLERFKPLNTLWLRVRILVLHLKGHWSLMTFL